MQHSELRSEPPRVVLTPRVLCAKCLHRASVILDHRPLCGECFLKASTAPAAASPSPRAIP